MTFGPLGQSRVGLRYEQSTEVQKYVPALLIISDYIFVQFLISVSNLIIEF